MQRVYIPQGAVAPIVRAIESRWNVTLAPRVESRALVNVNRKG